MCADDVVFCTLMGQLNLHAWSDRYIPIQFFVSSDTGHKALYPVSHSQRGWGETAWLDKASVVDAAVAELQV
eukprot:COSAG02_NODE_667_length_18713_cov_17.795262_10_plen_72_part_00